MTMELFNHWKGAASQVLQQVGQNRWGVVKSVRKSDTGYMARLMIQPEGVMTGWLPVLSPMVGAGWGLVSPPAVDMQAFVASDTGDGHHGVILGMAYSTSNMPPVPHSAFDQTDGTPVDQGEIVLVSKSGAVLRLCDDGTIHIKGDVRIDGNLTVDKTITSRNGDIIASKGNIIATQADITAQKGNVSDTHGSLDRLRQHYDTHTHGGNGGWPTAQQDPE